MKNVNLDYQPFEAGLPLEQILGVPLVLRAVLTCQKNGIDALTIRVLPDDGAAVETLLKGDARVTMAWQCTTQTEQVDLSGPVLAGNVVFLGSAERFCWRPSVRPPGQAIRCCRVRRTEWRLKTSSWAL